MLERDPIDADREHDEWWNARARELEDEFEASGWRRVAGWIAVVVVIGIITSAMARYLSWRS